MDWTNVSKELSKKLDPAHVKKPSGSFGPKGDYIEGWHAISEANRIFGFDGWSYRIDNLSQDSLELATGQKGEQWQAAYTCIVTVIVDGVTRQDVGFGSGFAKQKGDAIEGATKEAVTDALKRALRTFGNPFGLALYDKAKANVGVDNTHEIDAAIANLKACQTLEALQASWKALNNNMRHIAEQQCVIDAKDIRKADLVADMTNQGAG